MIRTRHLFLAWYVVMSVDPYVGQSGKKQPTYQPTNLPTNQFRKATATEVCRSKCPCDLPKNTVGMLVQNYLLYTQSIITTYICLMRSHIP